MDYMWAYSHVYLLHPSNYLVEEGEIQNIIQIQGTLLFNVETGSFFRLFFSNAFGIYLPRTGSSGIPGYPGIPGLKSNPDPGILENEIPGFFGIFYIKENRNFKDFFGF